MGRVDRRRGAGERERCRCLKKRGAGDGCDQPGGTARAVRVRHQNSVSCRETGSCIRRPERGSPMHPYGCNAGPSAVSRTGRRPPRLPLLCAITGRPTRARGQPQRYTHRRRVRPSGPASGPTGIGRSVGSGDRRGLTRAPRRTGPQEGLVTRRGSAVVAQRRPKRALRHGVRLLRALGDAGPQPVTMRGRCEVVAANHRDGDGEGAGQLTLRVDGPAIAAERGPARRRPGSGRPAAPSPTR